MADVTFEINCTRDIGRQILRHRSAHFQEFCIAGDSKISFVLSNGNHYSMTIENFWDKWHNGAKPIIGRTSKKEIRMPMKNRLQKMNIRVYDEDKKEFITSKVLEVKQTGIKPIFEIELYNGKKIKCTKEHKFLTQNGFMSLEKSVGLKVCGNIAVITNNQVMFATNGIELHQSYEWMKKAKEQAIFNKTGVVEIAKNANVSYDTIRKWLKKLNLSFTKKEVAQCHGVWNKGKYGYKWGRHSLQSIEKMRKAAKRGKESNLWKGGANRNERIKIADWCNSLRSEFLRQFNYKCNKCGNNNKLELHHVKQISEYPELAYEKSNIEVLCKCCHTKHHKLNGHHKIWRQKSKNYKLSIVWSKIKCVKYLGEQMTYDLEVDHKSHNYVANGIIVHNSQRYAEPDPEDFEIRECRFQDKTNRQSSIEVDENDIKQKDIAEWWNKAQQDILNLAIDTYDWAIARGIAKEQARVVLPEGMTPSVMYMKMSVRDWFHYCQLRMDNRNPKRA